VKDSHQQLINIIKDYIHKEKHEYELTEEVIKYARAHQLEALVHKQTSCPCFETNNAYAFYSYTNRLNLTKKISKAFEEANIPYFYVKGLEISRYYPDPYVKTMGDCDITVHKEDKERAADVLCEMGFREPEHDRLSTSEFHFHKNDLLFELHHALIYGEEAGETENNDFLDYFSDCWNHVEKNKLEDSFHLLYLIIHLRKHFMNKGIGLRQFLDIALFSNAGINWKYVEDELEKLDLLRFTRNVYGLIDAWWNVKTPFTGEISSEFIESATEEIMDAGVFGFENDNGENHFINNSMHGSGLFMQKIRYMFPSYNEMCKHGYKYPHLKGRPYLLPYYWIYRAFLHRYDFKEKTNVLRVSSKAIDERNKELAEWGLK